ncbi:Scn11a, partial [Symbiodinium pilosum]
AKLLRAFPEVLIMIKGISAAARSVFFTIFLLILVLYIFGIAFTQICSGPDTPSDLRAKFLNVPESMLTLLFHGVFMDDMVDLLTPLRQNALAFA